MEPFAIVALVVATFLLAGLVKGVVAMGLPPVAIGIMALAMPLVQAARAGSGARLRHQHLANGARTKLDRHRQALVASPHLHLHRCLVVPRCHDLANVKIAGTRRRSCWSPQGRLR